MTSIEKLHFVDLETTGANQIGDRITEIGIITVDIDGSVERWSSFINPGMRIPPFIQRLTGIDDDMVANAPPFAALADELRVRLSDGLFIAHNARFDYGFLHQAFLRNAHMLQSDMLCTVKLSRALFPEEKKHNLDTLIARHALVPLARHRALADADLLWQLWRKLGNVLTTDVLAQAVSRLRQRPKPVVDVVQPPLASTHS
jgi:DNA polymerase-3 subunit epsilon